MYIHMYMSCYTEETGARITVHARLSLSSHQTYEGGYCVQVVIVGVVIVDLGQHKSPTNKQTSSVA